MAFSRRKMLMSYLLKENFSITYCDIFSPSSPPPPPPPRPPPLRPAYDYLDYVGKQRGAGFLIATTLICAIASGLLLGFLAAFIVCAVKRFRRSSAMVSGDTAGQEEEEEEEEEERDFFDGNRGNAVDHHVWHIATVGLQRSVINSIAVFRFKKSEGLIDGTECSVCLNEFQEDEELKLLPKCSHAFHINCIDTWLSSHKNCPLCRAPIILNQIQIPSESLAVEMNSIDPSSSSEASEPRREEEASVTTIESGNGSEANKDRTVGSGSRNPNFPPRALSDLASHRSRARLDSVRRCYSIGSSIQKSSDTTRRPFFFSAKLFSARSSKIQDPVLRTGGSDPGSSGSG